MESHPVPDRLMASVLTIPYAEDFFEGKKIDGTNIRCAEGQGEASTSE